MRTERHVRLFRNGSNQALRIPREFELAGNEVILHKEGERLVIEPIKKKTLSARHGVRTCFADFKRLAWRHGKTVTH